MIYGGGCYCYTFYARLFYGAIAPSKSPKVELGSYVTSFTPPPPIIYGIYVWLPIAIEVFWSIPTPKLSFGGAKSSFKSKLSKLSRI